MADVRLTATNPEDSSVVPVACNEKGELKLEEIPDQSFDGNLQGNLTVSGSAEFAGENLKIYSSGATAINRATTSAADSICDFTSNIGGDKTLKHRFLADGSASFAGDVVVGETDGGNGSNKSGVYSGKEGYISLFKSNTEASRFFSCRKNGVAEPLFSVENDGSANFASRKAGFTAEGYLWCTTRRGDTVILDATSNGLASWVPYAPPNRFTELQDKLAELKPGPPTDIDSSRLTKD